MCNCSSLSSNICNQCSQGYPCGCPPTYDVIPQAVTDCHCCPNGYVYVNGKCQSITSSSTTEPIPCNQCVDTVPSDCVQLPAITCLGLPVNSTVTDLANYLCSKGFIEMILSKIGADSDLGSAFCQLVQNCPPVGGGTTPIIGSIIVTFP